MSLTAIGMIKVSLNRIALLLLIFFVSILLPFSSGAATKRDRPQEETVSRPVYGGIYRRGLEHDPATLDPAKITDIYEEAVTQQIFEGLVQYSDNLMVIPCLAESWESSRDNLRWIFTIKKGPKFHNGREVTADDFVYTFKRILDPQTKSLAASLLLNIEGARSYREGKFDRVAGLSALNRYTLEIRLTEPLPPFIAILAMVNFGVVPREEVERLGEKFGKTPIGTGPFNFSSWNQNEIILNANKEYHEGRPYLEKLVFKIFPGGDTGKMFQDFEIGKLEDSPIPVDFREGVLREKKYQVIQRPSLVLRLLIMNNTIFPFTDKRIRQAFNYAVDKERIASEAGKGRLMPAKGFIPEGMAGYSPEDINYPYSPEKARSLLKEAGYPDGKGIPLIKYWSSVSSKGLLREDELIKQYLSDIGIQIELNYETDWPTFKKMLQEGKAPIFKYSWEADIPDPDNILASLFYSKSMTNRAFYKNISIDDLIQKAQSESDYRKRISLYSNLQGEIMEDAPAIPLSYLAYERIFQNYVKNFEGKVLGDHYFSLKRVWIEKDAGE